MKTASNLGAIKKHHLGAAACEGRDIGGRGLPCGLANAFWIAFMSSKWSVAIR
jgi:hypothetical protein